MFMSHVYIEFVWFPVVSSSEFVYPEVRASPILTAHVLTATVCARMCDATEFCEMFNFNTDHGECRVFGDRSGLSSLVNSPGWKLWTHRQE